MTALTKAAREALQDLCSRLLEYAADDDDITTPHGQTTNRARAMREAAAEIARLRAALDEAPGEEREGWVLVPVEPTEAMINAAYDALESYPLEGNIRRHYRAMLAARPSVPQGEPATRVQWLRELLDSVMDFRPEDGGMVRGGPYVRADSLLQAAEVAAARPSALAEGEDDASHRFPY